MLNINILLFTCLFSSTLMAKNIKIQYTLAREQRIDNLRFKTDIVIFNDREFTFSTTGSSEGFCSDFKVGKFKGKLNKKDYIELSGHFKLAESICSKISNCSESLQATTKNHWRLRDYKNKKKFMVKDGTRAPSIISFTLKKIKQRQLKNIESLQLSMVKKNKSFIDLKFTYKGNDEISIPLSPSHFFLASSGGIKSSKKIIKLKSSVLKLRGNNSKVIRLQLKQPLAPKMNFLIYDNSATSHHYHEKGIVFSPCTAL